MSSPIRPFDRKDLLATVAFQADLLALATALETSQKDGSPSDFTAVTSELRHLEQMARETDQVLRNASPSAPPRCATGC